MLTTLKKLLGNGSKNGKFLPAIPEDVFTTVESADDCVSWTVIEQTFSEMLLGGKPLVSGKMPQHEKTALVSMHEQYLQSPIPENLVPRLPAVIPKIMLAMHDSETSATDLAGLLSGDIVLVGQVIQLANSAYYSRSQFYESLEQAIVNIGFDGIRQIIISAALKPILSTSSGHFNRIASTYLWDKSVHAGMLSDCAATKLREDRFHAYLASLTMQSGITMLSRELDKYFTSENVPQDRQFVDKLNHYAVKISARISEQWQFPEAVTNALSEQAATDDPSKMSKLGAIIFLSDKLSKTRLLSRNGYLKTFDTDITKRMPAGMDCVFNHCIKNIDMNEE